MCSNKLLFAQLADLLKEKRRKSVSLCNKCVKWQPGLRVTAIDWHSSLLKMNDVETLFENYSNQLEQENELREKIKQITKELDRILRHQAAILQQVHSKVSQGNLNFLISSKPNSQGNRGKSKRTVSCNQGTIS